MASFASPTTAYTSSSSRVASPPPLLSSSATASSSSSSAPILDYTFLHIERAQLPPQSSKTRAPSPATSPTLTSWTRGTSSHPSPSSAPASPRRQYQFQYPPQKEKVSGERQSGVNNVDHDGFHIRSQGQQQQQRGEHEPWTLTSLSQGSSTSLAPPPAYGPPPSAAANHDNHIVEATTSSSSYTAAPSTHTHPTSHTHTNADASSYNPLSNSSSSLPVPSSLSTSAAAPPPPPSFSQSQISLGVNSSLPPSITSSTNPSFPAAPSSTGTSSGVNTGVSTTTMGQTHKDKTRLEIILDAPYLTLKGTGPDVEPTTLSGHVFLYLTETTALKEITLQFRGKARIPMPANESLINNSTSITYVICNHDWSFLEHTGSSKRHSRSLKAGKHYFPFNLSIGGSLPSSISTCALGGASVAYKLRAVASRPGFAHNLQASASVTLLRAFTHEALEYQQSLEIENTWPEKIMYSIMLPHKAWAAGDAIGAIMKFSPLAKGVRVASVISALCEITKVYARSGTQEDTRVVVSTRHEIVEGRAVVETMSGGMVRDGDRDRQRSGGGGSGGNSGFGLSSVLPSPAVSRPASAQGHHQHQHQHHPLPLASTSTAEDEEARDRERGYENHDIVTYITLPVPPSSLFPCALSGGSTPPISLGVSGPHSSSSQPGSTYPSPPSSAGLSSTPLHMSTSSGASSSAALPSFPPVVVTPSHTLEPISVSHRIRWAIYIVNRDGHLSELRCSLPVIILDGRLKDEARDASLLSRRLMIRSAGLVSQVHPGADEEAWGLTHHLVRPYHAHHHHHADGSTPDEGDHDLEGEGDRELPSYTAHVRDRVANMFLPEAATVRVSNPWVNHMGSGTASPASPALGVDVDPLAVAAAATAASASGSGPGSGGGAGSSGLGAPGVGVDSQVSLAGAAPGLHPMAQLPQSGSMGSGATTPLEWVNSELMLSLSDDPLRRLAPAGASSSGAAGVESNTALSAALASGMRTPPSVMQYMSPGPSSRWGSRVGSRAGSRAGSPERGGGGGDGERSRPGSRPGSPTLGHSFLGEGAGGTMATNAPGPAAIGYVYEPLPSVPGGPHQHHHGGSASAASSMTDASSSHHGHGHGHGHEGHGTRSFQSLFKATIKPFTALSLHGHKHRHEDKDKDHKHSHSHSSSGRTSGDHSHSPGEAAMAINPLQTVNSTASAGSAGSYTASTIDDGGAATIATTSTTTFSPSTSASASADSVRMALPTSLSATTLPGQLPNSASTSQLPAMQRKNIPLANPILRPTPVRSHTTTGNVLDAPSLLHRALSEVPDYSIASRGFIGGVPPLSSMRGLPSYEEAVHSPVGSPRGGARNTQQQSGSSLSPPPTSRSEPDIAGRFAVRSGGSALVPVSGLSAALAGQRPPPPPHAPPSTVDVEGEEEEGTGILQRLESAHALSDLGLGLGNGGRGAESGSANVDADSSGTSTPRSGEEESEEDEDGIQMRVRAQTVTQR
ncbi:hypothetical protein CPC08DRAFT_730675 [Agrocybe pediades]|nr:hypothetical protein CPC08DRAFT_730675 [Agrocybe pediades]